MEIKAGSNLGGMGQGNGLGTSEAIALSANCPELLSMTRMPLAWESRGHSLAN